MKIYGMIFKGFSDLHVLCKLFNKKCRSSPLKCPWFVHLMVCTWTVTASAKVQQHFVGICFRTTERMLITFGPLYKPTSHVDVHVEYIPTCFPKASTWKTAFHSMERSGWCSVEMSLCLQWTQGNWKTTVGAGKGLKRARCVIGKVCGNSR